MERHPLNLSDQTSQKIGRKHLDQMPGPRGHKSPSNQDEQKVEKDLPERAHAGEAITTSHERKP